jgi:hypothetical protein
VFFKEEVRGREREVENRRGEGQGRCTSLPLKTDLTFIIYKIIKKTLVL